MRGHRNPDFSLVTGAVLELHAGALEREQFVAIEARQDRSANSYGPRPCPTRPSAALARAGVAHHQRAAVLVALLPVPLEVLFDLGLQEHPPRALASRLVENRAAARVMRR